MPTSTLILVLIVLTVLAYQFGRARSLRVAGGARGARKLHSLPSHYGLLTAIWCGLPALIVVLGWQMLDQRIIADQVVASMSTDVRALSEGELSLVLNDVRNAGCAGRDQDVLRLYEAWLTTGSRRAARLLRQIGIQPLQQPGSVREH